MHISSKQLIKFKLDKGKIHQPGSKSNQKPIGLSNLPNLIQGNIFLGKKVHQPISGMSELFDFSLLINNAISF